MSHHAAILVFQDVAVVDEDTTMSTTNVNQHGGVPVADPKTAKYSEDLNKLEHDGTAKHVDQKTIKADGDHLAADAKADGIDPKKVESALDNLENVTGKSGHGAEFAKDVKALADLAGVGNPMEPQNAPVTKV